MSPLSLPRLMYMSPHSTLGFQYMSPSISPRARVHEPPHSLSYENFHKTSEKTSTFTLFRFAMEKKCARPFIYAPFQHSGSVPEHYRNISGTGV